MLRVSLLIAALTLMETVAIVLPAAAAQSLSNATAFSFERCEVVCIGDIAKDGAKGDARSRDSTAIVLNRRARRENCGRVSQFRISRI
jgi:hypothetical protein